MSWISGDWVSGTTRLRSALRKAGVTRYLSAIRPVVLGIKEYEDRVDRALTEVLREGDTVWDVGANVGLYTERFAQAVGSHGAVVAFEPIATTHKALRERVATLPKVQTRQVALGARAERVTIALEDNPTSPTNSLTHTAQGVGATQEVVVEAGDALIASGDVPSPTVVKIDTEGFEEDVLWGMRDLLRSSSLRALLIEVHFAILEQRGYRDAPARLCSLLRDFGFTLRWVDASHLLATREPN